jgi:glutathione S-transferase
MLDRMEETLKSSAWLAGERYTIADIAQVPFVKRIDEEIAPDEMKPDKHPKVAAWWQAIQARPAFARARILAFLAA